MAGKMFNFAGLHAGIAPHKTTFYPMPRKSIELPDTRPEHMNAGDDTFTITELSREFDITPRAMRYYEDQGLISPRRAGHARVYSKRDRTRLKLTLRGKRLGLSLAEIRDLIDLYDTAHDERTQLSHFLVSLSKRKATLQQQREDIEAVLSEIIALERQCHELLRKKEKPPAGRRGAKKV